MEPTLPVSQAEGEIPREILVTQLGTEEKKFGVADSVRIDVTVQCQSNLFTPSSLL